MKTSYQNEEKLVRRNRGKTMKYMEIEKSEGGDAEQNEACE